jgi:hypothetical protein
MMRGRRANRLLRGITLRPAKDSMRVAPGTDTSVGTLFLPHLTLVSSYMK